jgi:hypothetical protein
MMHIHIFTKNIKNRMAEGDMKRLTIRRLCISAACVIAGLAALTVCKSRICFFKVDLDACGLNLGNSICKVSEAIVLPKSISVEGSYSIVLQGAVQGYIFDSFSGFRKLNDENIQEGRPCCMFISEISDTAKGMCGKVGLISIENVVGKKVTYYLLKLDGQYYAVGFS